MDKDFHYYGTYVAACFAGYSPGQAQIIAHAAQYVDDSFYGDGKIIPNRLLKKGDYGIDFTPIPTCHATQLIPLTSDEEKRHVWVPFHFLPGNYKSQKLPDPNYESRRRKYTGPREDKGWFASWKCNDRARWQFKLLCLPQSPLVTKMINQIVEVFKGAPFELHLAGMMMHVLADTGAHMYYAGTPAWHANDTGPDVFDRTVFPNQKIKFGLGPGEEPCTPPGPGYEDFVYLGHGRMGHIPDYPWLVYTYTPKWSSEPIIKDNPTEYLRTFREMVTALRCIRERRLYNVLQVDPIKEEYIAVVDSILRQKHALGLPFETALKIRCDAWKAAISNGSLGAIPMPQEYDPDGWINAVRRGETIKETDYYKFNAAAMYHLYTISGYLHADGIPINNYGLDTSVMVDDVDTSMMEKGFPLNLGLR